MNPSTIIIPARLGSSRFPNKVLAGINGESVIRRTIKNCLIVPNTKVIVLSENLSIQEHVKDLCECHLTEPAKNGTERLIRWRENIKTDIVINVQADEPFVDPGDLGRLITLLGWESNFIHTLDRELELEQFANRNTVKLLKEEWDDVIMFTRSPIFANRTLFKKHIGIYGFSRSILDKISILRQTQNSIDESLEQITWIENGVPIRSITTNRIYFSIDTEEDLKQANKYATFFHL